MRAKIAQGSSQLEAGMSQFIKNMMIPFYETNYEVCVHQETLKSFAALELYRVFLAISDLLLLQPLLLFLGEIILLHAIRIGGPPACSGK